MYSYLSTKQYSEHSGDLFGVHQKIDRAARLMLSKYHDKARIFPSRKQILHFEGTQGPDGLKRKSPGVDEPMHFIQPDKDDGVLIGIIRDHHYNLTHALVEGDEERAAFEAAWMAHAITDGLTPAHHYPYKERVEELMQGKDYKKLFGITIKGIMRGNNLAEALKNNWSYWGKDGVMTKHAAFEFGVAISIAPFRQRSFMLEMSRKNFEDINYEAVFYRALERVAKLDMYNRFLESGWTTELAMETNQVLIPETVKAVALNWASCINEAEEIKKNAKQ